MKRGTIPKKRVVLAQRHSYQGGYPYTSGEIFLWLGNDKAWLVEFDDAHWRVISKFPITPRKSVFYSELREAVELYHWVRRAPKTRLLMHEIHDLVDTWVGQALRQKLDFHNDARMALVKALLNWPERIHHPRVAFDGTARKVGCADGLTVVGEAFLYNGRAEVIRKANGPLPRGASKLVNKKEEVRNV